VVDVALGLVFVYFVMSVVCMQINEMISTFFKWRALELERGVRRMLADGPAPGRGPLADEVFKHPLMKALGTRPSYVPARTFALALLDVCAPAEGQANTFGELRQQIRALPAELGARKALLTILDNAQGTVENARKGVEDWFNATQDRIAGVYKRRLMWMNLVVATCVVVLVGADTIALATTLWQEQAIRAAVAASATQVTAAGIEDTVNALDQFNLPLGWAWPPTTLLAWFLKLVGLAVSVLAVSLGAPFWFDILKRVANLRGSGPLTKEPAPEAAPPAEAQVKVLPLALPPLEQRTNAERVP